jgi:hypothetical protein
MRIIIIFISLIICFFWEEVKLTVGADHVSVLVLRDICVLVKSGDGAVFA